MNNDELESKAKWIKYECASICVNAGKGHLSSDLSCAEIMTILYYDIMNIDPENPQWSNRDRFVMSKNHGSAITYPILCDLGFFDERFLHSYQKDGSVLGTHSRLCVSGVDFAGGSLGLGLGVACGMACAGRVDNREYLVFCLVGDCEMEEGAIWEAIMLAGHRNLQNLIMIVDMNKEGCTDFISELVPLDPLRQKLEAFGWEVREVMNGHSFDLLREAFVGIRNRRQKPIAILANTKKGNGVSLYDGTPWMHGQTPRGDEGERILEELMGDFRYGFQ